MQVKNDKAAAAAGFSWSPGDVVEVPDDVAAQLIAVQDGGFYNPADHPDGFTAPAPFVGYVGPGPTTKAAEWPTEGDDPVIEQSVAESPFSDGGGDEAATAKPKRARKPKTESEVDPKASESEVDPDAKDETDGGGDEAA